MKIKILIKDILIFSIVAAIFFALNAFAENLEYSSKTFILILLILLVSCVAIIAYIGIRNIIRKFK